ncbi:MAG TPA: hypothetical protein VF627_07895 [Abditibacterium sp.]
MKIRVTINQKPIQFDEILEADSDEALFRKLRETAAARAPFLVRMAMKSLSDNAIRQQIVERYNQKFGKSEPIPTSATEFLAFGERAGFVQRL